MPQGKPESSTFEMHGMPSISTHVLDFINKIANDISPMDIGVVICDESDVIQYTNLAFEYIFEYSAGEAVGKLIDFIFPPDEIPVKLYGTLNGEYDTVSKAGIRLKTIISTSLLDSGTKLIFFRDATRRKQAEGALARVETKNRALIDVIPDLMFIVKKDGTFVDYKVDNLSLLAVPPEQLIGKTAGEALPASIARRFMETVDLAIETRQTQFFNYEITLENRAYFYEARCVALSSDEALIIARDFTELKRFEESLKLTQFIMDETTDMTFWMSLDGHFVYVNASACKSLGYTKEELLSLKVTDINEQITEINLQEYIGHIKALNESGDHQFETVIKRKDGRWIPIDLTANYLDYGGREFICVFARDISERKHFEESIKRAQFSMDKMADMAFWVTLDGSIIYANDAASRSLGYTREELLSLKVTDLDATLNERDMLAHFNDLREHGSHPFETALVKKDGDTMPVEVLDNYLKFNDKEYLCTFVRDITERKRAEEASAFLGFIVESSDDAIVSESLDCRILSWNGGAEKLYGYTAEEAIGRSLSFIMPPDRPDDACNILEKVKRFEKILHYETERLTKNGSIITVSLTVSPIIDAHGAIIGASVISRDITESKRAEMLLLTKNTELAALNTKLRELSRAVEQSSSTVVITDINGNVQYVNSKFVALTGYTIEEVMGMNPRILKSGRTPPEVYKDLWETITSGREWHGEFQNRKKNGKLYWEYANISPITDNGGKITNFIAVKEDITERKQAEEAMRVKNRDLGILNSIASTINGTADLEVKLGLVIKDVLLLMEMDAGAVYLNDPDHAGAMSLMSFEYRTLAGKNLVCRPRVSDSIPIDIVCYDSPDKTRIIDVFENAVARVVVPLQIKNKHVGVMALYGAKPVGLDKCSEMTNIGSQVSIAIENYDLFKSIQATSKYLADVINQAPDAMLTVDRNGKILSFNRNAKRLLKYNVKEVKGKKLSSLLPKGDFDLAAVKSSVMDFRSKDGAVVQLNVSISRINKNDVDSDYIITLKDLSEISGLKITPIMEKAIDTARKFTLESGTIYTYDRRDEQDYLEIFADQVRHNVQGLCITRQSPVKIRQRLGLEKTPMIWLNASDVVANENCIKPDNLSGLGATLSKFLAEADNGFILIDGIEYLVARNGFETVLKFIHFLNDKTMVSNSSILIVLDPLAIAEQQYHLLTSEIVQFKK